MTANKQNMTMLTVGSTFPAGDQIYGVKLYVMKLSPGQPEVLTAMVCATSPIFVPADYSPASLFHLLNFQKCEFLSMT